MFQSKFGEQNHQVSVPLRGKGRDQLVLEEKEGDTTIQ